MRTCSRTRIARRAQSRTSQIFPTGHAKLWLVQGPDLRRQSPQPGRSGQVPETACEGGSSRRVWQLADKRGGRVEEGSKWWDVSHSDDDPSFQRQAGKDPGEGASVVGHVMWPFAVATVESHSLGGLTFQPRSWCHSCRIYDMSYTDRIRWSMRPKPATFARPRTGLSLSFLAKILMWPSSIGYRHLSTGFDSSLICLNDQTEMSHDWVR